MLEYHNGILYGVSENNGLFALDPHGGSALWAVGLPEYYSSNLKKTNPVYHNDIIYVAGLYGIMMAVDAATGETIWQYDFKEESDYFKNMYGSPALYGDYLVYGTLSGSDANFLYCLNNKTGELLWRTSLKGSGVKGETVVVEGNMVYVPGEDFEARDLETGELVWSFPTRSFDGPGKPLVVDNKVLFNGAIEGDPFYASLYCLDRTSGNLIWEVETGFNEAVRFSPNVAGNFVFGFRQEADPNGRPNGRPFAVSLENGQPIWENNEVVVRSFMVYANGRLFFPGLNLTDPESSSSIICLDASTGEFLWDNPEAYYPFARISPIVVAENGIFKP